MSRVSHRRMRACLRACRGIPTTALEAGVLRELLLLADLAIDAATDLELLNTDLVRRVVAAFNPRERS